MAETAPAPTSRRRASGGGPSRKKVVWSTIVTVVVLAVLIIVVAALSSPARETAEDVPTLEEQSTDLVAEALQKLTDGDEEEAIRLLREATVLDPTNQDARDELAKLTETQDSGNGDGGGDGDGDGDGGDGDSDPPDDSAFLEPVDDLTDLLPASVSDFDLGRATTAEGVAEVAMDPVLGGAYEGRLSRALLLVHDKETAEGATEFIERSTQYLYPEHAEWFDISGVQMYFGTDGGRGATATFVRGRYVFETILAANMDLAENLTDVAQAIAAAYPDSLD